MTCTLNEKHSTFLLPFSISYSSLFCFLFKPSNQKCGTVALGHKDVSSSVHMKLNFCSSKLQQHIGNLALLVSPNQDPHKKCRKDP